MARYQEQAQLCSQARLLRTMELLTKVQSDMKWLRQPRALLETMLVRICRPEDEHSLLALEDRLSKLEQAAANGIAYKAPEQLVAEQTVNAAPIDDIPYEAPPWDDPVPPPMLEETPQPGPIAEPQKPLPAPRPLSGRFRTK
jgi:DNA polymerase III gamma/tau subunit